MTVMIAVLAFLTICITFLSIYSLIYDGKRKTLNRMKYYTKLNQMDEVEGEGAERTKTKIQFKDILSIMGGLFATGSYSRKIEKELLKAEIPMKGEEFIALNFIALVLVVVVGILVLGDRAPVFTLAILVLILPSVILKRKKRIRIEKLNNQIGEALTIMANALRAGYSFQQTIDLVSKEMSGPLAVEFARIITEINLGTPVDQALSNLTERVESDDIELLITAVLIQRQIGGNLAEILDNISFTIRERIRIKGEIKTLTAQGRISGLIIGLMPPILFVILMLINPSYMTVLLERKIGWMLLGGGMVSQVLGIICIKKVVDIEV